MKAWTGASSPGAGGRPPGWRSAHRSLVTGETIDSGDDISATRRLAVPVVDRVIDEEVLVVLDVAPPRSVRRGCGRPPSLSPGKALAEERSRPVGRSVAGRPGADGRSEGRAPQARRPAA